MTDTITTPALSTVTVNQDRLWESLMTLARVGAYGDAATGLVGVNRQSLTDADRAGRELFVSWLEEAGLQVRVDQMGNIIGRRQGSDPGAAPVMAASHIDSVATAGAFDGCLGVLGALEVVRTLNEQHITTVRPIEIAALTEEEGVRFGTDKLGSAVAAGRLTLGYAYDLVDEAGLRFGDELDRIGFRGDVDVDLPAPHAYVECHIEQGRCSRPRASRSGSSPGCRPSPGRRSRCMGGLRTPAPPRPSCGSTPVSPPRRSSATSEPW